MATRCFAFNRSNQESFCPKCCSRRGKMREAEREMPEKNCSSPFVCNQEDQRQIITVCTLTPFSQRELSFCGFVYLTLASLILYSEVSSVLLLLFLEFVPLYLNKNTSFTKWIALLRALCFVLSLGQDRPQHIRQGYN